MNNIDLLIGFLVVYCIIATLIIILVAMFIIVKGNNYAGKFKRNITYVDNVLSAMNNKMIESSRDYNDDIRNLKEQLKIMIEISKLYIDNFKSDNDAIEEECEDTVVVNEDFNIGSNHNINVVEEKFKCPSCGSTLMNGLNDNYICENSLCNWVDSPDYDLPFIEKHSVHDINFLNPKIQFNEKGEISIREIENVKK